MAYQYVTFPIKDLGGGIDQQSSENQIKEGFCELIMNGDPQSMGYLSKRLGYQRHAGQLPVRVTRVEYTTNLTGNLCFYLDSEIDISSVNLLATRRVPIVVQGRVSSANTANEGDFKSDSDEVHYYATFDASVEQLFLTGTNTLEQAGVGDEGVFVHTSRKLNIINTSNEVFNPDGVTIDSTTGAIDIDYVNNTGQAFSGYVYNSPKPVVAGETYRSGVTEVIVGSNSISIPTATHNLSNFNIDTRVYRIDGDDRIMVQPDEVTIDTTGNITIELINNEASSFDVLIYCTAYPAANIKFEEVADGATVGVEIDGLTSDFIGVVCYLEDGIGGPKVQVEPDSIVVDSTTNTATVTFINNSGNGVNFIIHWEEVEITSNRLCVDAEVISNSYVDAEPQLTIWGLSHEILYSGNAGARAGWVTHLDSYKSTGESKLVAGLGGVLYTESTDAAAYLLPTLYPDLNGRIANNRIIGPVFWTPAVSPLRTSGWIKHPFTDSNHFVPASSIEYISSGVVDVRLDNIDSYSAAITSIINTLAQVGDVLNVKGAANSKHNGSFPITGVTINSGTSVTFTISNPLIKCADFNEVNTSAKIGVFTDRITEINTSKFQVGDKLASGLFEFTDELTVVGNSGSTTCLGNLTEEISLPAGLRLIGQRQTNVIPLRDVDGLGSVEGVVGNDSITLTDLTRKLTVKSVNPRASESVTIVGNGTTATVTLSTSDITTLYIGQYLLFRQSGDYTGAQEIIDITDNQEFVIASNSTTSVSGTIVGSTIEIDEVLTVEDSIENDIIYRVASRWAPIEAPLDSFTQTKKTYPIHLNTFPYTSQPTVRSVMVNDNLYLTNGADEVMKYDGVNLYRAGIPRWQPQLFITTLTNASTGGNIDYDAPISNVENAATAGTRVELKNGEQFKFRVGDEVVDDEGNTYTVLESYAGKNGADDDVGILTLSDVYDVAATTISKVGLVKYYFRVNAIDANGNIISSATVGSSDTTIRLAGPTQVRIRMVGMPTWDVYDYDTLELEVYRTEVNTEAPYYKLITLPMNFNNNAYYVDFKDVKSGESLRNLDVVNTAFFGGLGLGTQFSEPMRAKYVTSAGNRLVLGNVLDYQQLDIRYESTNLSIANLAGGRYLFRRDNTDDGTTSNLEDRQGYEFTSAAPLDAEVISNNSDASFTVEVADVSSLSVGQWLYLMHSGATEDRQLQYAGWFKIDSIDGPNNRFTVLHEHTEAGYTPSSADVDKMVVATQALDLPVYLGNDGNYSQAFYNADGSNPSIDYTDIALIRLANAINTSMRATANPWIIAGAGGDFQTGQLIIRQPKTTNTFVEVVLPTYAGYRIFVQGVHFTSGQSAQANINIYPSRVLISGNNYPEVFNNPRAVLDTESTSAIDVNSADGQQITGIIPFFGDSAFGSAQKDGIVVVFKEESIYIINLEQKSAGQPALQRLESQGRGCTAPNSIAVTKDGVLFANRTGIFRLTRDLRVEYVGQRLERLWQSKVNQNALEETYGHFYAVGMKYKLSYPLKGTRNNSNVLVYDPLREYVNPNTSGNVGRGSWTEYDNHPATAWANLNSDAFFATSKGSVMVIRNTGLRSDFRDDDEPIHFEAILRATDFGDTGVRKVIANAVLNFRNLSEANQTKVFSAMDLSPEFEQLDNFLIKEDLTNKVVSIQLSISRKKGVYFQLKLTNEGIDESVELTSVDIRVAGLSDAGILQAAKTTK